MTPTGVFTTTSPFLLIKAASGRDHRSLYSWEPNKPPKLIVEGRDLDVTRLSDDTFAAWYPENGQEAIVILNAQQVISEPLTLPPGGPTGWNGCAGDMATVVCLGDPPGMSPDDKEYDEMGFSAVVVVDLARRKTSWFPVKHRTHFRLDLAGKTIYVSDGNPPFRGASAEAFDFAGNARGEAQISDITLTPSPSGHFSQSLQEDGSESWETHEKKSTKVLLAFNCDRPECKVGDQSLRGNSDWNPIFDGQFVVLRDSGKAYGEGSTCDIYQPSPARLLKSILCSGLSVYDWSRDGRELITLNEKGNKLRRERVN